MNNICKTAILTGAMVVLFLLPDYLYQLVNTKYEVRWIFVSMRYLLPLSVGLVINKFHWLSVAVIVLLCALQLMQFSKLAYFNRYITSYDFVVLLKEWRDVFLGAGDALSGHWVIIPMVAIPFALMILVSRIKINRSKYGVVVLFGTFACITVTDYFNQMYSDSIKGRLSIDNTLKTFSLFMLDLLRTYEMPEYKDYEIKNVGAGGGIR